MKAGLLGPCLEPAHLRCRRFGTLLVGVLNIWEVAWPHSSCHRENRSCDTLAGSSEAASLDVGAEPAVRPGLPEDWPKPRPSEPPSADEDFGRRYDDGSVGCRMMDAAGPPFSGSQVPGRLVSGSLGHPPPSSPAPLAPRCAAAELDRGERPRGGNDAVDAPLCPHWGQQQR